MFCLSINRPKLIFFFLLNSLITPTALAKGSENLATQLLQISGLNAIYAQGIVAGYKSSTNRSAREINCFTSKVTSQLTLQPLATGYATEFDDAELQKAISFFKSASGKKYAQYQRIKSNEMFGVKSQEKEPSLTPHDLEQVNSFLETRIGKLMLSTNSPMSVTASTILKPQLITLHEQCIKSTVGG